MLLAVMVTGGAWAKPPEEALGYDWRLRGFLGAVVGLFLPNSGEACLSTEALAPGRIMSQLTITASRERPGEYWRYGAEIDESTGRTLRAWSEYWFRGRFKRNEDDIEGDGVFEFASAIRRFRQELPRKTEEIQVWSDGKEYPVLIIPRGVETLKTGYRARRFATESVQREGEKKYGLSFELWFQDEDPHPPVRLTGKKGVLRVTLDLQHEEKLGPGDKHGCAIPIHEQAPEEATEGGPMDD
jgi:hypothetical protein